MKVLVVEDNPSDVELLAQALRDMNSRATLTVAESGEDCLEMLNGSAPDQTLPDLIFLDLNLPKLSGYDVLRQIKGDARTRHIPVIVLSSSLGERDVERAYEAHANAFVQKPKTLADLLQAAKGLKSFWMETARLVTSFAADSAR